MELDNIFSHLMLVNIYRLAFNLEGLPKCLWTIILQPTFQQMSEDDLNLMKKPNAVKEK